MRFSLASVAAQIRVNLSFKWGARESNLALRDSFIDIASAYQITQVLSMY